MINASDNYLSSDVFLWLNNLENLSVNVNQLVYLPDDIFTWLSALSSVDMEQNCLSQNNINLLKWKYKKICSLFN